MGILWKIEGQYERFTPRILDCHATLIERGLSHESDLGINFSKSHVLVIPNLKLAYATTSTMGVKQRWTFWAKLGLGTWLRGEAKDRTFLLAQEFAVNNPLGIDPIPLKFLGRDGGPRILKNKIRVLVRSEVELIDQVFPVFVAILRIVLFSASIECIGRPDTPIQREILSQKVLIHGDV